MLRSDKGKEYNSKAYGKFCEDESVEHQLTIGYAYKKWSFRKEEQNSDRDGKINIEGERPSKYILGRGSIQYNVHTKQISNKSSVE